MLSPRPYLSPVLQLGTIMHRKLTRGIYFGSGQEVNGGSVLKGGRGGCVFWPQGSSRGLLLLWRLAKSRRVGGQRKGDFKKSRKQDKSAAILLVRPTSSPPTEPILDATQDIVLATEDEHFFAFVIFNPLWKANSLPLCFHCSAGTANANASMASTVQLFCFNINPLNQKKRKQ